MDAAYTAGPIGLLELCDDIDAGFEAEKCMFDDDMITLAQTLCDSTGEIRALIDRIARLEAELTRAGLPIPPDPAPG